MIGTRTLLMAWLATIGCAFVNGTGGTPTPSPDDDAGGISAQLTACCECLATTSDFDGVSACLGVSLDSCETGATFGAQCFCWEACYFECASTLYPFAEEPNGCFHEELQ